MRVDYITEGLRPLAVSLDKLSVDPHNARKHPERSVDALAASLQRFGQRKPIVVNRASGGTTIAGSGTIMAARKLGWDALAVVFVDDTEETARAFALADNQTALFSEWDDGVLLAQLRMLDNAGELEGTGFAEEDISRLLDTLAQSSTPGVLTEPFDTDDGRRANIDTRLPSERAEGSLADRGDRTSNVDEYDDEDEEDDDDGMAVTTGAASRQLPMLCFGTHKVPMTPDELEALKIVYQTYVQKTGVGYGFVAWLLDADEQDNRGKD